MLDVQISSPEAVMRQAWMTSDEYFTNAIECIDKQFGDGYAKQHPELVGAFMHSAVPVATLSQRLLAIEVKLDLIMSRLEMP
jgi:hypothetical protein